MSSQTYRAVVRRYDIRRQRKTVILTDVALTNGANLPTHRQTWVSPGTWGHLATPDDRITFDAEVSASTGRLIYISHVYNGKGQRLDQDKSGQL